MSPTDLLIDGYNLLHAAGLGRTRYGPGDLQRARQSLLRQLFQLLTPEEVAQTAVVFDARQPPPHLPALWYIHGLRVVYAQPHGDADLILEELIDEHSAPRRLTVVSSDHRLHRAAKARRASAINSDEFLEFLERRRVAWPPTPIADQPVAVPHTRPTEQSADITATELAYWMRVFGDVKVSDLIEPSRSPVPTKRRSGAHPAHPVAQPPPTRSTPVQRTARRTKPAVRDSAAKPTPELFSAEWISELQRWVDQQQ